MTRKLGKGLEALEGRRLMTVGVEVIAEDLVVTGSPDGDVAIVSTDDGVFEVYDNGILVDSAEGVSDDIRVSIDSSGQSVDRLTVQLNESEIDQLMLNLGNGENEVALETGSVSGSVRFNGGSGDDSLEIADGFEIGRSLNAYMRGGNDTFDIDGDVLRSVNVYGGQGEDYFEIGPNVEVGRRLNLRAGSGDNTAMIEGQIGGNLYYRGGAGDDVVDILANAAISGRSNVLLGGGDNSASIEGSLGDRLRVTAGAGDDELHIAESVSLETTTRVRLGAGDNTIAEEGEQSNRMVADAPLAIMTPTPEPVPTPVAIQAAAPETPAFDPLAFWEQFFNREFQFTGSGRFL